MNIKWQNAEKRAPIHHAAQITEEVKGTAMEGTSMYQFPFGELIFVTGKTDTMRVGDWVVKTEKGYEFFTAAEFKKEYMEPT